MCDYADLNQVEISEFAVASLLHTLHAVAKGQAIARAHPLTGIVIDFGNNTQAAFILRDAFDKADTPRSIMLPQQRDSCFGCTLKRAFANDVTAFVRNIE
jgi:hypothetical protein